jgi:hypothetical protein
MGERSDTHHSASGSSTKTASGTASQDNEIAMNPSQKPDGQDGGFNIDAEFITLAVIPRDLDEIESALQRLVTVRPAGGMYPRTRSWVERGPLDLERIQFGNPQHNARPLGACVYQPTCSPSWCVFVANIPDGWSSLLRHLCRDNDWPAVRIRSSRTDSNNWIQEMKSLTGCSVTRWIRTMWDGRPEFYSAGTPLACEELELYHNRKIRDRLSRAVLARYLTRLGYPVGLPAFWESRIDAIYCWHDWE